MCKRRIQNATQRSFQIQSQFITQLAFEFQEQFQKPFFFEPLP